MNIFCSKIEKTFSIDEVDDLDIVLKGVKRRSGDHTRYYIRISFKDKKNLLFGECLTVRKASDKVSYSK